MKLLFITQKLHQQDAFGILWIDALRRRGFDVQVLCLECDAASQYSFSVHSLGKERRNSRGRQIFNFLIAMRTLQYDRVFIHMSPVWYAIGWWYWLMKGIPVYMWYTHYKMQLGVLLFGFFGKRFFCATPQSLPQYASSSKKIVTGHGIDLQFWQRRTNSCTDARKLLIVHRLSRSKRLELVLHALTLLPSQYTVDIYGIAAELDYAAAMRTLVQELGLESRIRFHGTVPMQELPAIYTQHALILNMASETIDKTMLEAMTCGCYPITTSANSQAIGIPSAPSSDSPKDIARFIEQCVQKVPADPQALYDIVLRKHSLEQLVATFDSYIRAGT